MHEGSITIRLPGEVPEPWDLRRLVAKFGDLHGVPEAAVRALSLSLDEVVTNSLSYAFANPAEAEVCVRMELAAPFLRGEVVDRGRAFNPLEIPLPDITTPLAQRPLGGLGIYLVQRLMDQVAYRREGASNVLTLLKRVQ